MGSNSGNLVSRSRVVCTQPARIQKKKTHIRFAICRVLDELGPPEGFFENKANAFDLLITDCGLTYDVRQVDSDRISSAIEGLLCYREH